ncbi:DUF4359 domain-containing protein [Bacillus sp. 165]|uniref:DUF4359 domain-containing protein n=1 Tax=Bacillus sp. 165 TaxID=1529117 RepID=UPI001ADB8B0A|nr:DUF4359 domain-containing protein [Bacillus sp. 165]MBO9129987.1 DUF4359 domain-containing protein [Bacillus sp. 165]
MKGRYISVILFVVLFIYLASSNPSKGEYTAWASEQIMTRNEVHAYLSEVQQEDEGGLLSELAGLGKKLAKRYLEPQVGILVDKHTKEKDYMFLSMYTTKFNLGRENYEYVTLGIANHFIPVKYPQEKKEPAE